VKVWLNARKSLLRQAVNGGLKTVVFIMSSPWDLFLGRRLEREGVNVVRIIHDANPHPGEKFPPNFWIRLLIKDCSKIVTLSNYVAGQLTKKYRVDPDKIMVCSFPVLKVEKKHTNKIPSARRILLIGRGKRYQGQKLLEEAWSLMAKSNIEIVIAGEGFKPNSSHLDIEYKNWWMTRDEMIEEISSSDLVVFPYIEASQSGTIPICKALGIPVLVTPVGGLVEQVENFVTGLVCESISADSLAVGIQRCFEIVWQKPDKENVRTIRELIECL
jgi:glycosyltransferase involved in cell wall biosynthesis